MRRSAVTCAASLLATCLLGGCASAPPRTQPASAAAVDVDTALSPLAPPDGAGARSASQVIRAAYGARSFVLRTAIEAGPGKLDVVGVTATGQRVFSAHYDGLKVSAQKSPFVPDKLEPERVLADMQLALWPLAAVQAAFRPRGLTVTEPFSGLRRMTRGAALVAEVHYAPGDPWNGRLWFVNFEFDYSLTIDTTAN
jgi:hypothetical protein